MPTAGTARFAGYTGVAFNDNGPWLSGRPDNALLGWTTIRVDFGTGDAKGAARDFVGRNSSNTISQYTGKVKMTNGRVGTIDPNTLVMDYAGVLVGNGNTLEVGGTLGGRFLGTPIRGLAIADAGGAMTLNGTATTGDVLVIARKRK